LNFCIDVGGYGVLGLFVGWMIWAHASWVGYFIGVVVIGIGEPFPTSRISMFRYL
jgi:hypothetical protein